MAINSVLERVLQEDVVETSSKDKTITLQERDENVDMEVEIVTQSASVIAIRMSARSHLSTMQDGPWKQVCDYLLVVESANEIHAVFIELKRTLTKEEKPREQLRRSPPFLEYLLSVCKIENNSIKTTRINTNYFIIGEKLNENIDKESVRINPNRMIEKEQYKEIEIATSTKKKFTLGELTTLNEVA